MTVRRVGNRAFAPLNEAFSLPGSQNLNAIDIGVAQPVVPLERFVQAGLMDWWHLAAEQVFGAAGDGTISLRPQVASDWDSIVKWDQQLQGTGQAVPEDHDVLVVGATIRVFGTIVEAAIRRIGGTGGTLTIQSVELLYYGDTQKSAGETIMNSTGETIINPMPWFVRDFGPDRQGRTLQGFSEVSAASTVQYSLSCWSAIPGIMPRVPI